MSAHSLIQINSHPDTFHKDGMMTIICKELFSLGVQQCAFDWSGPMRKGTVVDMAEWKAATDAAARQYDVLPGVSRKVGRTARTGGNRLTVGATPGACLNAQHRGIGMSEVHGANVVHLPARGGLGLGGSKPLDHIGDLFDRPNARVFVFASRDPSDRVVADPGLLGDLGPCTVPLERLEGGLELLVSHAHAPRLGARALKVKALTPKAALHHSLIVESTQEQHITRSVFVENLQYLIGESSVNAWAKAHGLEQTTIQRLLDGSVPKLPMLEVIAKKTGVQTWQLLAPGMGEGLHMLDGKSLVPVAKPQRKPSIGEGVPGRRRAADTEEAQPPGLRRRG